MYELLDRTKGSTVGIRVTSTLTCEDYEALRPLLEQKAREHGPLRVLLLMEDGAGGTALPRSGRT